MQRPVFKFLNGVRSLEEAKTIFKQKALILHPDRGGNTADFQQLNAEYQYVTKVKMFPVIQQQPYTYTQRTYKQPEYKQQASPKQEAVNYAERARRAAAERNKQETEKTLEWDIFKSMIDAMVTHAEAKKHNIGTVYFNYIEFLQNNEKKTTKRQLEYIAIKLGYASGWAYYKSIELKKSNLIW